MDAHVASCDKISPEVKREAEQIIRDRTKGTPIGLPPLGSKRRRMSQQTTLEHGGFDATPVNTEQQAMLDKAQLLFFVMCGVPYAVADNPWFVFYVQAIKGLYNPADMLRHSWATSSTAWRVSVAELQGVI